MANNTGATCVQCGKGRYKVFDLNDDIFGDLHCDNCKHHVKFNQDLEKHLSPQVQAMTEHSKIQQDDQLQATVKAVIDAAELASWDWGNMMPSHPSEIAAAAIRAATDEIMSVLSKHFTDLTESGVEIEDAYIKGYIEANNQWSRRMTAIYDQMESMWK